MLANGDLGLALLEGLFAQLQRFFALLEELTFFPQQEAFIRQTAAFGLEQGAGALKLFPLRI